MNVVGSALNPGTFSSGTSVSGFTNGAPTSRNGASVPRPSDTLVPSTSAVPGYAMAASGVFRFGDGGTQSGPCRSTSSCASTRAWGSTVSRAGFAAVAFT